MNSPPRRSQSRQLVFLFLLGMTMGVLDAPYLMAGDVQERLETFTAGDQPIRVECFKPSKAGSYPAILLLHGADGLETSTAGLLRWVARDLARHGYVVQLVHYFDRTGIKRIACADIPKKDREADRLTWLDTVCLAIRQLARSPEVDSRRIGVVGVSLGAYLAVAAATKEGASVAAVVELFGGLPPGVRQDVTRIPPVLIIHGTEDQVVKVSEARKLEEFLHVRQASVTITVYEGIGHVFTKSDGTFQMMAALDAKEQANRFLDRHLCKKVVTVAEK